MKKAGVLLVLFLLSGCVGREETYPYGLTETEWKSLSIRDQTRLRRDFYFYEKGATAYVNPSLEVEGKDAYTGGYLSQNGYQKKNGRSEDEYRAGQQSGYRYDGASSELEGY